MTIELDIYLFYGLIEVIIIVALVAAFVFRKNREYKPYFLANVHPSVLVRRYIKKALENTRRHATSLEKDVNEGDRSAVVQRRNMVARMNWLVLERDFLSDKMEDEQYWQEMSNRISRLLDQWDLAGIVSSKPDVNVVKRTLGGGDGEGINHALEEKIREQKARIKYLEKQVHQLDSYRGLYEGIEGTYGNMKKSYKKMKNQLFDLQIEADKADKMHSIIREHESTEETLEQHINTVEKSKERLNQELMQLEAAYMRQMEELDELKHGANQFDLANAPIGDDVVKAQDIMVEQSDVMHKLRTLIHGLKIDLDKKMEFEELTTELEQFNEQIITCMQILELQSEQNRLKDQ
ncbi:MAG: hypothetical protein OEX00_05165 [Gammaproteobacteria bacterium]|nr:hypothetical protein [Gammaproteobacteria bacterium]MDH5693063.1 hypothetical protein [Gammaproteobacteria bacterium]